MRKITRHMYQSHLNELSKKFSNNYLDSIHTTVNMIFKHAIRQVFLLANPIEGFVMPKKQITIKYIEEEELNDQFLKVSELKAFLCIAKEHGLSFDYLTFAS
ncbi:hypothetical protein SB775_22040 [Peribacillus sp. SIMBA_075]|uniref:hypothetical protein n=1 Tax=Peribacillus sp. SIMBA_075 TaxID=3085813 RepID=UPI00397ACF8E